MPTFNASEPTVQAAVIRAAVETAKSMFKKEAVNPRKVAMIAMKLSEQLKRAGETK